MRFFTFSHAAAVSLPQATETSDAMLGGSMIIRQERLANDVYIRAPLYTMGSGTLGPFTEGMTGGPRQEVMANDGVAAAAGLLIAMTVPQRWRRKGTAVGRRTLRACA